MYNQQRALHMNQHPHPRTDTVKKLIKNAQSERTVTRRKNYEDRGVGSLLDGYHSQDEFIALTDNFFLRDDHRGRVCFLLSHFGLLRGENARDLELADMFSQVLDGEGYSECVALVLLIQHGKTNNFGKLQHVGFMRNKNVNICPVGAVAMYLFQRFHVDNEPFPSFKRSADWYDIKFLRGRSPMKSISYDTHKKSYESAFKALNLIFNKKTHINRHQGVRHLESLDVDISQTRRHGRWGLDSCEGVYSAPLAREAMRGLSGFPHRERLYYLPRSILIPPIELQKKIFPQADQILQKIIEGEDYERNLAAKGFLELVIYLRRVLLQDAALLQDRLTSSMWSSPVFTSELFVSFKRDLQEKIQSTPDPAELRLQQSLPLLHQQLHTQHSSLRDCMNESKEALLQEITETKTILKDFIEKGIQIHVSGGSEDRSQTRLQSPHDAPSISSTESPIRVQDCNVLNFRMSRQIRTVHDLWQEWFVGIGDKPAVIMLEQQYGTKWRSSAADMKFFSRRKIIVKYVQRLQEEHQVNAEAAVRIADIERGRSSLDAFSKRLSREGRVSN